MAANFVLGSQEILTVPQMRKELSWQLGVGGWKPSRLRLPLASGLVDSHFELPHGMSW
jgi:hypothetical protein